MNAWSFRFLLSKGGRKFLFATILMGAVIIGGVTAALFMLRQEAIDTHIKIAELHAHSFGDHLSHTIKSIDLASESVAMLSKKEINTVSIRESFDDMIESTPYIRSVNLLNENGVVLVSTNKVNVDKTVKLGDFLPTPFLNDPMLRFGRPWKGRDLADGSEISKDNEAGLHETGFIPIIKTIPIKDKDYTLLICVNSDYFVNSYLRSLSAEVGFVDIARIDGTLLFSTDERLKIGKTSEQFAKLFSTGKDASSGISQHDERDALFAYQLSPTYPVGVVVRLDYDTTLKQWEKQRINVLLITTMLVIVSATLTLMLLIRHKKQQMMEAQLLKSKIVSMSELIGMIAHQWRQPLSIVSAIFSNISDAYEDGELTQEYLDKSVKQGNDTLRYMSKTIDSFRGFFKPQESKEEFCLCHTLSDAVKLVLGGLQARSIKIFFNGLLVDEGGIELCKKPMPVTGYKNEFLQAAISIIKNSKEAIEGKGIKNGAIYIKIEEGEGGYKISFLDNGGGVGKEAANRIFEPYFTTKHNSMGAGMGLYVAKMLIENGMGGKLGYENTDNGALFVIELDKNSEITENTDDL